MFDFFKPRTLKQARNKLLLPGGLSNQTEQEWFEKLSTQVHKKEFSYLTDGGDHYLQVGLSAMRNIQKVLEKAVRPAPSTILDFPCGFARVLRLLKTAYPISEIEVADLDPQAIRFCSQHFQVKPYLSSAVLDEVQLENNYDLIWCGSLITHLSEPNISALLRLFYRHLNTGGICVFTSHGIRVEKLLKTGEINYSLLQSQVDAVLKSYWETGIGFSEYLPSRNGYGISLTSDQKIRDLANLAGEWECLHFEPAGWDNHQDVYSYYKRPQGINNQQI